MENFLPIAFFEGKFINFVEAKLSVATHALHYGTGAFGGMRGVVNPDNKNEILLFRLDKHTQRLARSAKFLQYDIGADFISEKIVEFVKLNKPEFNFYIRPFVYASETGIAPRLHNIKHDFLIYGLEMGDYLSAEGIKATFSSWFRPQDNAIPTRGKLSGTYINSAMAKTEAVNRGFDEALMLDNRGYVTEASAMNIFMVKDGQIITPGSEQDILEGITRRSLIEVAQNLGYKVVERNISKTELLIADEVFLSGTAAKVTPIYQIENFTLPTEKPISSILKEKLTEISLGKDPQYEAWITRVGV
ncbi:MAG: branched-chain amino acid transaminase [bacterium]